ncbi:helix-turn-helix domain-containing protein [Paenibacillus thalictri]|uniref:XRE family transcriptional regulator n=1 Tax=Paenibacillus thalictri TaxID=2527873 RepID=A0A4Q9DHD6_9BACL|nr:helix-turn-helix transcriptional regulator [Paenibacillus thalictri]TBL70855.1 XRE family transcriptional regulator [Paenibacillus thalictri]
MRFGNRIAELRNDRHMTQEDLAQKLGISRAALSHYENNRREPDHEITQKLADLFKVSVDYLMGRSQNQSMDLTLEAREFIDSLELSDQDILDKFSLTIDGTRLSQEEAKRFIAFIRAERSMR